LLAYHQFESRLKGLHHFTLLRSRKVTCIHFYVTLSEVPGAAWDNLQPAYHLLFCKQCSKMCPSAFRVSGPQAEGGGGGDQNCTKSLLGEVGMCVQNFIKISVGFGFPLALHIPTDKETYIFTPIYVHIEDRFKEVLHPLILIYLKLT